MAVNRPYPTPEALERLNDAAFEIWSTLEGFTSALEHAHDDVVGPEQLDAERLGWIAYYTAGIAKQARLAAEQAGVLRDAADDLFRETTFTPMWEARRDG